MFSQGRVRSYQPVILSVVAVMLFGSQLMAQKFATLPVTEPSRGERKLARDLAKGSAATDAARGALAKVVEAEMRRLTSPDDVDRYSSIRMGIYNEYLATYRPEAAEARKIVIDQIVKFGSGIAQGKNFSPQSRINALALLAELDDLPAIRSEPPSPAAGALAALYKVAGDDTNPAYLRCIALYGLERHIGRFFSDWNPQQKSAIGRMLVGIVNSEAATDLDAPTHAWMVRRAFDCLGATGVAAVADNAIQRLGNPEELPSVRLSAAEYLTQISSSSLSDEQKQNYLFSLAHFTYTQLVAWYEKEDDLLQRATGAAGGGGMYGGMGGYGGMMGGYGGGGYGGDGGGGGYGGDSMYGGMGGMGGMGGYGGYGGAGGGRASKPKAIDTQDWQTILARRKVNQIMQVVHLCLNGRAVADGQIPKKIGRPLSVAQMPAELQAVVTELTEKLEALQEAVNDIAPVKDVNSLLQQAETPIEDIMDLVEAIPGFAERYPDIVEGAELEHVEDKPAEPPAAGNQGAGGQAGDNAAGEGQPGEGNPPQGDNGQGNSNGQ
ncbi:MAG: hypothetical protein NXI32_04555 [bacterium]|nr:hypothetical protein [bacterium]